MLTQYDEGTMTGTARASSFVEDSAVDEIPVFRPLAATMNVDLVMNPDSKVWILHDKPFPDILMWVEYDIDAATLTLVYRNGKVQELGIKIHAPMRKYLRSARQLFTMRLEGEQIADTYVRPLLVRETGYYKA